MTHEEENVMLNQYIDYVETCIQNYSVPELFADWHDAFYHYEKADNND
jgi:hypothetical protein